MEKQELQVLKLSVGDTNHFEVSIPPEKALSLFLRLTSHAGKLLSESESQSSSEEGEDSDPPLSEESLNSVMEDFGKLLEESEKGHSQESSNIIALERDYMKGELSQVYELDGRTHVNPFQHDSRQFPRIITYECPHCNRLTTRKMILNESNITHCHHCRKTVIIEDIMFAKVKCKKCGSQYTQFIANGLKYTTCKDCYSEIDLEEDPSSNYTNLISEGFIDLRNVNKSKIKK